MKGSDSEWFKSVLKNPTVTLAAGGAQRTARATPIPDPAKVREVEVAKYYSKLDVAVRVPLA